MDQEYCGSYPPRKRVRVNSISSFGDSVDFLFDSSNFLSTCLMFNLLTSSHSHPTKIHMEKPERISNIVEKHAGEVEGCEMVEYKEDEFDSEIDEKISKVHSPSYLTLLSQLEYKSSSEIEDIGNQWEDVYLTPSSYQVARFGCDMVWKVCEGIMKGRWKNGFALVRPPGHHASSHTPGF